MQLNVDHLSHSVDEGEFNMYVITLIVVFSIVCWSWTKMLAKSVYSYVLRYQGNAIWFNNIAEIV